VICWASPEGVYAIEASKLGFLSVRYQPIRVYANQKVMFTMRLPVTEAGEGGMGIGSDADVRGTVADANRAIKSGKVCLTLFNSRAPAACTFSDDFGEFLLSVPKGIYELTITASGYKDWSKQLDLVSAGLHVERIVMETRE